jgi:hypothetical protein
VEERRVLIEEIHSKTGVVPQAGGHKTSTTTASVAGAIDEERRPRHFLVWLTGLLLLLKFSFIYLSFWRV